MNYNVKCNIERINGVYQVQMEVSGVGRAKRKVFTMKDFDVALLKAEHDAMVAQVTAYHDAPVPIVASPAYKAEQQAKNEQASKLLDAVASKPAKAGRRHEGAPATA